MNRKQLIWIGAGTATTPVFDFNNYASVTLVEAREDACRELSTLYQCCENVTVKHCCVSDRGKKRLFFTCNVKEFSALASPDELKSLYPGLIVEGSKSLETVSIEELVVKEARGFELELFIDIPATAGELVRKLDDSGILERLSALYVTGGSDFLYKDSLTIAHIKKLLNACYFYEADWDGSDPDIPIVTFVLNQSAKALDQLKAESEKLKNITEVLDELKAREQLADRSLRACQQELDAIAGEIEKKQVELETVKKQKEVELSKCRDEAEALIKKNKEIDSINTELSISLDNSTKQNLKLQLDLDDMRERFAKNKENEARLESLIIELYEKLQKAANFYHRLEKLNPELLGNSNE